MFLVEYEKNTFVNGQLINWIRIDDKGVIDFTIEGEMESSFYVEESLAQKFLNNIGAINNNLISLENRYHAAIKNN